MLEKLITEVLPIADLKELYTETFLNHTSKISKISDLSVMNAHAFGVAKIFQKDIKDTAILESQMFPELSSGVYLDNAAKLIGAVSRNSSCGSSTYELVYAKVGTVYVPGQSTFTSTQGVSFNIVELTIVGENGYAYVPIRSSSIGVNTNVDPFTINSISAPPIGHFNCTNEYAATGGRDSENDEDFKTRLSTFQQFAATSTYLHFLNHLRNLNADILDIRKSGYTEDGKVRISIITCNGKWFSQDELGYFEYVLNKFIALSDVDLQAGVIGIKLINIQWHIVGGTTGVDFRVDIFPGYSEIDIRRQIQLQMTKYFDFRFFTKDKVEWDDLLTIVKSVRGVKYVPDEHFNPGVDSLIEKFKLPRVVKFVMRDMKGTILYNNNSSVLPIYYPV